VTLDLPWPPSVNAYWRSVAGRTIVSAPGRAYRTDAYNAIHNRPGARARVPRVDGRVRVTITAHPPDHRRRDLDNLLKATLDALVYANVLEDDGTIDDLRITRAAPAKLGRIILTIEAIP
jgi:crossover junction endodeoxyribonuclease RusA